MPPVMNRKSSNERCRKGWELRTRGRTWQEIADEIGYKDRHNARNAITNWLRKNPPDDLETARRATGDAMVDVITRLQRSLERAAEDGDHQAVATLGRAVLDGLDRRAKLIGLHVVVPQQVEVNVRSAVAVIERAEQELLAIAQQPQPEIVDAEVIDE